MEREFSTIDIGSLAKIGKGRFGDAFASSLHQLLDAIRSDEVERTAGFAKGTITITLNLEAQNPRDGDRINLDAQVSVKLPKGRSAGEALSLIGDALAFDTTPDTQARITFPPLKVAQE